MSNVQPSKSFRRHCMVVHHTYPLAEPRVERDAQALVSHGYEVDVICLQEEDEPAVDLVEGVNIYRLPVRRDKGRGAAAQLLEYLAFFILAFFKLISLHRRRRYKVVQVHNLPDFLVLAALWPKLAGARVILDIHDVMPEFYAARFKRSMDSWPVRLVRWQERLSCRFADHVITVTELWRQALITRGVPAEKVSVVMHLADQRVFRPPAAALRVTDRCSFKLIYHGSINQRYGLDLLVRAVDVVRQRIPEIHLTIHGGGDYRNAVMQLVEELKLQQHVYFSTNKVPIAELPKIICQADVGVVPYRRDV